MEISTMNSRQHYDAVYVLDECDDIFAYHFYTPNTNYRTRKAVADE